MKRIAAIFLLSTLPSLALGAEYGEAQNLIGIYGQIVSTPSSASISGGNTVGGVGIFATGVNSQLWTAHLGFNYAAGAPIGGAYPSGYSMQFNLRLGKLFAVTPEVAVGPYLAYQYANFRTDLNGNLGHESYQNNAIGGGVEATTNLGGPLDFTGHLGYLAGVGSSASASGFNVINAPSADDLQIGARAVYAFTSQFSAFAGVAYDHYQVSYDSPSNEIRGLVGMAYHF